MLAVLSLSSWTLVLEMSILSLEKLRLRYGSCSRLEQAVV